MYNDAIFRWNCMVGCHFSCIYCLSSFQRQMKRQKPMIDKNGKKRGCQKCYDYEPHFHPERLNNRLPLTKEDEFIWCCSSSDICFAEEDWINQIIDKIKEYPNRTFFMQTKDPRVFQDLDLPNNLIIGITLETNRDKGYELISKAPNPKERYLEFDEIALPNRRKFITIEPILDFDLQEFIKMIEWVDPERVYIGYNSKKTPILPEPPLSKTLQLIRELRKFTIVKEKLIREARQTKNARLDSFI